jgi:hypothetical protein
MNELRMAGARFLAAFDTRDFAQVQACFHPQVQFRALIPPGVCEAADALRATNHLREWFGGADHLEILNAEVGAVGDRLHLAYRLRVHDADGWQLFEQQTYCRVQDCQIAAMDLLCSGPQPDPAASAGSLPA